MARGPIDPIPTLSELDLAITTPRLRLRAFAEDDLDALWTYTSDPEIPRLMSWAAHTERAQSLDYIRHTHASRRNGTGVTWAIEHAGRLAGVISLEDVTFTLRAWRIDRAELGYWIAPALWGQGLMTEAARAVLRAGFDTIGLHKITVGCLEANAASRRVIEKLGFRGLGRRVDDVWRDGAWWSVLRYELTCDEWLSTLPPP
ncbi:MAG TPA: GNAT family N-acetyltransferase [Kofleriaceae bacterium]|nr:GNAT family N-acetyltransferase [Kofleriaceae bacterium]